MSVRYATLRNWHHLKYIVYCGFLKVKDYVFFHLHLNFIEVYPAYRKRSQILCLQGEEIHKGYIASTQLRKQYLNCRNFSPLFSSHYSPLFSHQGNQYPSFSHCRLGLHVGAIFSYQKKYLILKIL